LDQYDKSEVIRPVGNLTAKEIVVTGAEFQVGESPILEAECALVVWYKAMSNTLIPRLWSLASGTVTEVGVTQKIAQSAPMMPS
jgi:hypothetical protein